MTLHQPPGPGSPPAVRLHRPGWRDTRFLLGIGLVGVSVAIGATAFAAAGRTVPVYAAAEALVPGDVVRGDALVVRDVRLSDSLGSYLRADEPLPEGLTVVRTVGRGELVALSAVEPAADLGLRPVAITPDGALSSGVTEGSTVDLWFVPVADDAPGAATSGQGEAGAVSSGAASSDGPAAGETPGPVELASGLTVAEITEPSGSFSVGSTVTVHVLVPLEQLADILAALAADGSVAIVPVPGQSG